MTITLDYVKELYARPVLDLVYEAAGVHRANHNHHEMQLCALQSIKTGGCAEDCGYCSQSAHHEGSVKPEPLQDVETVLAAARNAKSRGATRFCMGAAWRGVAGKKSFERILEMVRGVKALDLEACMTLGEISEEQAVALKAAGLSAYNHNLDTSEDYYKKVITTRTYDDRLKTISHVGSAGISLCCGGIIGMGEAEDDRISLLHKLATLDPAPESVPINMLVPVKGTPMEAAGKLDIFEWIKCVAVSRILLPKAFVRLSAGRESISKEAQALAFLAGANAIFIGDKLLTVANASENEDAGLLEDLGLTPRPSFKSCKEDERAA